MYNVMHLNACLETSLAWQCMAFKKKLNSSMLYCIMFYNVLYICMSGKETMSGGASSSTPAAWSLHKLRSISQPSLPPTPNPTLVEVNEWVWPSYCHQHEPVLRHGQLLRWMDVAACLSGERMCRCCSPWQILHIHT